MAQIVKATDYNLNICKQALVNSQVIAVPTETVYGIAGNALDKIALKAIFDIKNRPLFNPLIIHTDCIKSAEKYAFFNPLARQLAENFWPGPLTMILPKKEIVPNLITANLDSVAIRCPQNSTFLKLLKKLPFPVAAPSANPFGYVSPTSAEHVNDSLGDRLEFILDDGDCTIGIESTIVDLRNPNKPKILRPGPIFKEELKKLTNIAFEQAKSDSTSELRAPGMLKSHYSPITPLKITPKKELQQLIASNIDPRTAFIFQKCPENSVYNKYNKSANVHWLSESGEASEIAQNFYQILRATDTLNYELIYIEAINETEGIMAALKDRLIKAASK